MAEVLLILLAFFLAPQAIQNPLGLLLLFLVVLPGLYAMLTGAPFVPSSKKTMQKMLELADIQPHDQAFDLGCGDGRLVFAAAKKGAKAKGFELSPLVYLFAKCRSIFHHNASIHFRNFWSQSYKDADVIFCYLLVDSMQTFRDKIWPHLQPGCRVVSHAFAMDGIEVTKQMGDVRLYVK